MIHKQPHAYTTAAVTACKEAGLSQEALQSGVIKELIAVCEMVIRDVGNGGPSSDYVSHYTVERIQNAIHKAKGAPT